MPFNIGPFELLLVLVLALIVLGPGKLPEVGNALGKTIREFRKASTDVEEAVRVEPVTPASAAAKPVATAAPAETIEKPSEDRAAS
jgi:sec-independent protein translocase protein TatA